MTRLSLALGCILVMGIGSWANADRQVRNYENVLGTSFEFQFDCDTVEGEALEAMVFSELDRLKTVLNHYDKHSEISRLVRELAPGEQRIVSDPLRQVLAEAELLRQRTGGAFDIRAAELTQLWHRANVRGEVPSESERHALTTQLAAAPYVLEGERLTRLDSQAWSLDAIAKGYILDSIAKKLAAAAPQLEGLINIGGDIRTIGRQPTSISVEDPSNAAEGAGGIAEVLLPAGWAVCTSGSYRRGTQIGDERFSHIIDPRSGLPCGHVLSSTVIAESALVADALATAVSVLPPAQSLQLVAETKSAECLLILPDGGQLKSEGWPKDARRRFISFDDSEDTSESKKAVAGLIVDFTLDRPEGARYRRPYVAVWLEDKDGFPVKTAILWMQTEQPGPRWHRDLTRWYRTNRMRKTAEKTDLIGTISGATRGAGEYQAIFEGTDNAGKPLPDGVYTLCLEVAREHGTYQLIREQVELNGKPIAPKELKGNVEMHKVAYRYIPAEAAKVQ